MTPPPNPAPTPPPQSSGAPVATAGNQPRIHLAVGRKACGKTTLAIEIVNGISRANPRHQIVTVNPTKDKRLKSALLSLPPKLDELNSTILFVDEVRLFISPHLMPPELRKFLIEIWHRDNYMITTSRRFSDLHGDLVSSADYLYIFRLSAARDLEAAKSYLSTEHVRESIPALVEFQYLKVAL